jgi:DNA-binding IclR family transcriptional regulator
VGRGEIFGTNQVGLERMTVVGQVPQQTSELDQIMQAACSAQGRVLIAQRAPAQEMVSISNCYFTPDSLGFPTLLPFFDAQSGSSLHALPPL